MISNKQNFKLFIATCLALGIPSVGTRPAISGSPPYGSGQQIKESHVNPMAKASKAAGKSKKTAQTVKPSSNQTKNPSVMPLHTPAK